MSCHLYSSCPHTTKHKTENITTRQMGSQLAILCTKLCADSTNIKDNSSIVWSVTLALKMSIHSSYFQHPCHTAHYHLHFLVGKCLLRTHRMLKLIAQTNLASLLWVSCSFVFLWIWVRLSFFQSSRILIVIAALSLPLGQLHGTMMMVRVVNIEGRCELSHGDFIANGDVVSIYFRPTHLSPLADCNTEICFGFWIKLVDRRIMLTA